MSGSLNLKDFQEVPKSAVLASGYLTDTHIRLGSPSNPLTAAGQKVMKIIIAIWEELYPLDAQTWSTNMNEYKRDELSIGQQVARQTGRSLASVPLPIFQMMKKVFPHYQLESREDWMKFLKKFPMFRAANKL